MSEYKRLTERKGDGVRYDNGKYEITCYPKNNKLSDVDKIAVKLCEFEDKIEDGTLVELPCRLGEHFVIQDYGFNRFKVEKVKIIGFNFSTYDKTIYPVDEYETYYTPDKVFDAEEAAEARLKELQDGEE